MMAIWKTGNGSGKYFNEDAKELVAQYILRSDKALHGFCGSVVWTLSVPQRA